MFLMQQRDAAAAELKPLWKERRFNKVQLEVEAV